jgi:hypothetical protein
MGLAPVTSSLKGSRDTNIHSTNHMKNNGMQQQSQVTFQHACLKRMQERRC